MDLEMEALIKSNILLNQFVLQLWRIIVLKK